MRSKGNKRAEIPFSERVYAAVRRIPAGKVASYGDIAALLGTPRAARGVGWALNALDGDSSVPWWRVINKRGAISIRHPDVSPRIQRALLEDEGIEFDENECVDWAKVRWIPEELLGSGSGTGGGGARRGSEVVREPDQRREPPSARRHRMPGR